MDYMDIDEESNVPDTPDRIVAQNINARDFVEKDFLDEGFRNRPKDKSKLVTDNGSRRLLFRPAKNSSIFDKYERVGNSTVSSLDDSSSSENAHPFERMFGDKITSDQKTHSIHSEEDSALVDLTERNGHAQEFKNARCEVGSSLDRGKGIGFIVNSQPEVGKTVSASLHPSTSRRVTEQRRLVRNGCISPHNIAKAKESAENHGPSCVHSRQNNNVPMASHGPSSLFGMRDLIAEANDSHRLKGKGSINHPFPTKGSDAKTTHLASRSSTTRSEKADGTSNASGDAPRSSGGGDGWRSTRNRTRKTNPLIFNEDLNVSSRDDDPCFVNQQSENGIMRKDYRNGFNGRNHNDYPQESDLVSFQNVSAPRVVQTVSDIGHQSGHFSDHQHAANALMKRQKQVSSSSNHGLRILDPVIEVDEFSPEIRNRGSNIVGGSSNDDSDVRARQVEADEILARELQEELYNEAPVVGVDEIDSHMALAFQQEEDSHQPVFGGSHREFYPRGSLVSNLYRQFESSSSQNPSIWRDTPTLVPTSTRMARLRDRFRGQPHTMSSSTDINSFFPPNVDMDMRIRILEALEAFSELEMSADLPVHRDFNENDYEMLLALDENNHQVGASPAQINGLPQSTVQSDNHEETCAICLETPSIGDTLRHLPCVHRFHKDCIDPWLRRRTSCPICKSSIT